MCGSLRSVYLLARRIITARAWWNQRNIYRFKLKLGLVGIRREGGLGGLQPVLVVALGEVGLVMRAARFVAHGRALGDHASQLQHVVELARENDGRVGPLGAVTQVDIAEALEQV